MFRRCAVSAVAFSVVALAQIPAAFEVASIRPNTSGAAQSRTGFDGGYWNAENITAGSVIATAFHLQSFQLAGEPPWATAEHWDIRAKTGSTSPLTYPQLQAMLQTLLAERLQMQYHHETRQLPIYALTVAKSGLKATKSDADEKPSSRASIGQHRAEMTRSNATIADLLDTIASRLSREVVNETGLVDHYDMHLEWDPDPNADSQLPSVFTALQEQLGLKLESETGPVDVVVVDRLERPSN